MAVLLAVLATAARCGEGAKDQALIDRLAKVDIVTVSAGATKISSTHLKDGGSDFGGHSRASSILMGYATPLPPMRVGEFYHRTYE